MTLNPVVVYESPKLNQYLLLRFEFAEAKGSADAAIAKRVRF